MVDKMEQAQDLHLGSDRIRESLIFICDYAIYIKYALIGYLLLREKQITPSPSTLPQGVEDPALLA